MTPCAALFLLNTSNQHRMHQLRKRGSMLVAPGLKGLRRLSDQPFYFVCVRIIGVVLTH